MSEEEEVQKVRELHAAERVRQVKCHEDVAKSVADHRAKHEATPPMIRTARANIEAIDGQILVLLRHRACMVEVIALLKGMSGIPVHDPAREADLLARLAPAHGLVRDCYRRIIEECREHAKRTIAEAEVPGPDDGPGPKDPA